jgi:GxxExxY protein
VGRTGPAFTEAARNAADELSNRVIGAAIEVHRHLGPGLLEGAYEECLAHEFDLRAISYRRQHPIDLTYKGVTYREAYRLDFLASDLVVIELKAVDKLEPVHDAQLLTYLRLTNLWLGLLINFNVPVLRNGIQRRVLG